MNDAQVINRLKQTNSDIFISFAINDLYKTNRNSHKELTAVMKDSTKKSCKLFHTS